MKTLYLVRHAKSEPESEQLADVDRPLTMRGTRNAHEMGRKLSAAGQVPELIIASAAVRTISTALIFAHELNYDPRKIKLEPSIYRATTANYLASIADTPEQVSKLMIVGHNPTVTELVALLTGKPSETLYTCAVVCITIKDGSWKSPGKGSISFMDFPKRND